jgi:hypothetical protein
MAGADRRRHRRSAWRREIQGPPCAAPLLRLVVHQPPRRRRARIAAFLVGFQSSGSTRGRLASDPVSQKPRSQTRADGVNWFRPVNISPHLSTYIRGSFFWGWGHSLIRIEKRGGCVVAVARTCCTSAGCLRRAIGRVDVIGSTSSGAATSGVSCGTTPRFREFGPATRSIEPRAPPRCPQIRSIAASSGARIERDQIWGGRALAEARRRRLGRGIGGFGHRQ